MLGELNQSKVAGSKPARGSTPKVHILFLLGFKKAQDKVHGVRNA